MKVLKITLGLESSERGGLPRLLGGIVISEGMSVRQIQDIMRDASQFVVQYLNDHEMLCVDIDEEDPYGHEV